MGGTSVKFGLFCENGELLKKWEIPTRKENHGAQIVSDIAESILKKMEEQNLTAENMIGVGMGVSGTDYGRWTGGSVCKSGLGPL